LPKRKTGTSSPAETQETAQTGGAATKKIVKTGVKAVASVVTAAVSGVKKVAKRLTAGKPQAPQNSVVTTALEAADKALEAGRAVKNAIRKLPNNSQIPTNEHDDVDEKKKTASWAAEEALKAAAKAKAEAQAMQRRANHLKELESNSQSSPTEIENAKNNLKLSETTTKKSADEALAKAEAAITAQEALPYAAGDSKAEEPGKKKHSQHQ
jgi:hypothetical protein